LELNGAIVVDKPKGWTSHDVVNKVRRIAGTKKVGHLGTLDPLATGVLPLLLNRTTRLAQYFQRNEKAYEGVISFGHSTDSYDADGDPTSPHVEAAITRDDIEAILPRFRGSFDQTPPPVSAKKIKGRPAYELVRKNQIVELKAVPVTVYRLDLLALTGTEARVHVHCSAGTYLRSIAHEIGRELGCGAHLKELRRVSSGPFALAQARNLEELQALNESGRLEEALIPARDLLPEYPSDVVDPITESQIRNGRDFRVSPFRIEGEPRLVRALSRDGQLLAIGEIVMPHLYHPVLVL
jgi:tRNA pseudouridine55 synthase